MSFLALDALLKTRLQAQIPDVQAFGMLEAVDFADEDNPLDAALAIRLEDFSVSAASRAARDRARIAERWTVTLYVHRARVDAERRAELLALPDQVFAALTNWTPPLAGGNDEDVLLLVDGSVREDGPLIAIAQTYEFPLMVGSTT